MDGIATQCGMFKTRASGGAPPNFGLASRYFSRASTDRIEVATPGMALGAGDFTIAAWSKLNAFGNGNFGILSNGFNGAGEWALYRQTSDSGPLRFIADAAQVSLGSVNLNPSQWYHFAITRVGNLWTMWVDGVAVDAQTLAVSTTAKGGYIGSRDATNSFDGLISDVRHYNRGLSGAEISDIIAGIHVPSGLVGWWILNDDDGPTTIADNSGSGFDGVNFGTTYSTDGPRDL